MTISKIQYDTKNKLHSEMIETVKNHLAIYLPEKTLNVIRLHLDLEREKHIKKSNIPIGIMKNTTSLP